MRTLPNLLFLLGLTGMQAMKPRPKRPHIVLMIADDLGWNDVSFHGSKQIPTPNVDALARDGVILNQHYVQPLCSPTRGSLMTGKYPIRIGFQHFLISNNAPWGLPLKEKILPQYLKEMNYATHAVGKWHLGYFKEDYLPLKRGFDSYFGYYNGVADCFTHVTNWDNMSCLDLHDNYETAWEYNGTYGPDLFTEKAKKVIQEHDSSQPLFLYFAQQAPHSGNFDTYPLQAPDKYVQPMVAIDDQRRKIFAGMVSSMDHSVGEIVEALEKSLLLDDTIFIFISDNGGAAQELIDQTSGSNWPLKGTKETFWEGGTRGVALIWSPLLRRQSRTYDGLMHVSDWLPTILSAAGGPGVLSKLPKDIDGVNQWPSILHSLPSLREEILLNLDDEDNTACLRRREYKLVKGSTDNGTYDKWYDQEGRNTTDTPPTDEQIKEYKRNYKSFLTSSKVAKVLREKFNLNPLMSYHKKKDLVVNCTLPRPRTPTCNTAKGPCLFDILRDPCEYHNIAEQKPELVAEMENRINEHRKNAIPPGNKPSDARTNPELHVGACIPWK